MEYGGLWRELSRNIPNPWETKIEKNTRQRKTITRTRQYLCGSTICLHPQSCKDITIIMEEYKVQHSTTIFSLCIKQSNNTTLKNPNYERRFHNGLNGPKNIAWILHIKKNHAILFGSGRQTRSNKIRLHKAQQISHLETSSITNIKPLSSKKQSPILATYPPVLKLEDQLKLRTTSTCQ